MISFPRDVLTWRANNYEIRLCLEGRGRRKDALISDQITTFLQGSPPIPFSVSMDKTHTWMDAEGGRETTVVGRGKGGRRGKDRGSKATASLEGGGGGGGEGGVGKSCVCKCK